MTDDAANVELPVLNRTKWFRRARVVVSVFFGLLTLALSMLWVTSYSRQRHLMVRVSESTILVVESMNGRILINNVQNSVNYNPYWFDWNTTEISEQFAKFVAYLDNYVGFGFYSTASTHTALLPYWFVWSVFALIALSSPWRFRFSLRTLLIATTLVALVLGPAIWMLR
ncbi:MAG: hypothetical protein AB7G28_18855 [Pirellulales bacterium]